MNERAPAMRRLRRCGLVVAAILASAPVHAQQDDSGSKASVEQAIQSYLAMWSNNTEITAAVVDRFYAPEVIYYGKHFSRADVLADKQAYIKAWPVRTYREVPGSFSANCNADRSLCHVSADMTWRRVSRRNVLSTGRARIRFDFVPVEGSRKIARETARLL